MIKCMDNQVVPSEIELLVSSLCPGVQEICVVGLPHPEYGEVATAFVILKKDYVGKVTADDIKNIVAGEPIYRPLLMLSSLSKYDMVHASALAELAEVNIFLPSLLLTHWRAFERAIHSNLFTTPSKCTKVSRHYHKSWKSLN
ncbi:hypothetical protein HPB48_021264 [Haemaphysalis longicornis]|uniref:AMP-binding enzyme C-terminal domain-containing protein n=1 Tax=Haemaphysalis longicornis TaxID=44386 RepID=A0A9J6F9V2_HAELO|nr:hypothetical protein HPB48_021264 [Haemaphysalis longicornis]